MTKVVVASLVFLVRLAIAAGFETAHIRNFGAVNENIFRGGAPTSEALQELKALGVKLVLDLREDGQGRLEEKNKVEQLGLRYEHIPMRVMSAPRPAEIEQALSLLLREQSAKIYIHCLRGKDRTGTVIACYRIQHDGWDNRRALAEAKDYGMSSLERAMQSFILHFSPLPLPVSASATH